MISESQIKEAVENTIIKELRLEIIKHIEPIIEDTIVNIMQKLVIRMYQGERLNGISFDIEIKKDTDNERD